MGLMASPTGLGFIGCIGFTGLIGLIEFFGFIGFRILGFGVDGLAKASAQGAFRAAGHLSQAY